MTRNSWTPKTLLLVGSGIIAALLLLPKLGLCAAAMATLRVATITETANL